jgi:hypothetical protein
VKGFSTWRSNQRFPVSSSSGSRERFSRAGPSRHVVLICSLFVLLSCPPLMAQVLPAGTTLEVRLSNATGSSLSHAGDCIEGTIIAPVSLAGKVVVPQGSGLIGSIESVKRFGLGLKHVTAAIHYRFHTLQFLNGEAIPIETELLEVETAKERVDIDGTVRGIHPAVSLSSSLALFTVPLVFAVPTVGVPVWGIKSMIAPSASPEIYFPSGTELILRLTAPVEVRSSARGPVGVTSFPSDEINEVHQLLKGSPQRARLGVHPSDFVNLLFLGSREELDRAFHAAGWSQAERKSPMSLYRMYYALTRRIGYRRAPMNTLTLNGAPADFVYQKNLDTVQKRHHVRLWKDPHRANVWLGAAAEDIAFRFELTHWTHSTAPNIDNERAKVVNDLAFTECLEEAGLVSREPSDRVQGPKDERLILTDTDIAVVRLNGCNNPRAMPRAYAIAAKGGHGRLLHGLVSLRNDLRLNPFFTTYNTLKLVSERRTLKPLRKTPSVGADPPGLDWLSALATQQQSGSQPRPVSANPRPTQ